MKFLSMVIGAFIGYLIAIAAYDGIKYLIKRSKLFIEIRSMEQIGETELGGEIYVEYRRDDGSGLFIRKKS